MTINKRDIIIELRRMAVELEAGEEKLLHAEDSEGLPDDVLDTLADRFGLSTAESCDIPVETIINDVDGVSIVDALEAFVQAGAVKVEVHPAFWDQWRRLFKTFRVDTYGRDAFSPCVELAGDGPLTTKRAIVASWKPCPDILCAPCRFLAAQWQHRMPEEPKTEPPRAIDPDAN